VTRLLVVVGLLVLAACGDGPTRLPPSGQAPGAERAARADIHAPDLDLLADRTGFTIGKLGRLERTRNGVRLELIEGTHIPAWMVRDGHGGHDIVLLDRAKLHVSGLTSGTLTVLDEQGVALVRVTRDGHKATAADGARRLLGSAQASAGQVALFTPDGTPAGQVAGITDPGLGLAVGLGVLPQEARALLAASAQLAP
jgi:predicted small lipoprotein YifL